MDKIFKISGKFQEVGEWFGKNFVGEMIMQDDASIIGYVVTTFGCNSDNGCVIGVFVDYEDGNKIGIIFHKYTEKENRPTLFVMPDIAKPNLGCWVLEDICGNNAYWEKGQTIINISSSEFTNEAKKRIMDRFNYKFSGKIVPNRIKHNSGWYRKMFNSAIKIYTK